MLTSLLLLSTALAPQGPTPAYSCTVLPGHLPSNPSFAQALNDRGAAVGYGIEQYWFEGALWPDPQTVVGFATAFGFEASYGYGINDAGAFVGSASFDATASKETIFLAEPGQQPRFLPQLVEDPGIASVGIGISDSGLIAGACDSVPTIGLAGNPQTRAVLWENDLPRNLGTLGGDYSRANAINDHKLVVGVSNLVPLGLIRAFAWTESGGMVRLPGLFPQARTMAVDVNASGLIVGDVDGEELFERFAAMWPDSRTLVTLPLGESDEYCEAVAVNDAGEVVGRGRVPSGFRARLWQNGAVYDLDALAETPGLTVSEAVDINDRGEILAQAWDFAASPPRLCNVILTPDLHFDDLGLGLPGSHGTPTLRGYGTLIGNSPLVLEVEDARASAPALLVLGAAALRAPLFGGTLVPDPSPPGGVVPLMTDGEGRAQLRFRWLAGVPAGASVWYQVWVLDPAGPFGLAATNGLRSTAP